VSWSDDLDTERGKARAMRSLIRRIAAVLRTAQVHYSDNPALAEAVEILRTQMAPLMRLHKTLKIEVGPDDMTVNGEQIADSGDRPEPDLLTPLLRRRRFVGIEFSRVPSGAEFRTFLGVWRTWRPGEKEDESFNETLGKAGVRSLRIVLRRRRSKSADHHPAYSYDDVLHAYCALLAIAERVTDPGTSAEPITHRKSDAALQTLSDMVMNCPEVLLPMTSHRDPARYECVHAANTAVLAMLLGRRVGLGAEAVLDLGRGGLHADVAMALLANDARDTSGPMDRETIARVLVHPIESFLMSVARGLDPGGRARAIVAYEHHTGVDGEGYPGPAPGGGPHLFSRIVAVADAYDALAHDRGDRAGLPRPLALEALHQEADRRLDRRLLHAFFAMLGRFPPGSIVRLDRGEIAIIASPASDLRLFDRPVLYLIRDRAGDPLRAPRRVDLAQHRGERGGRIASVLNDQLFPERLVSILFRAGGVEPDPRSAHP
jgi:HD-GYP domain-containing protein (c-di-GMP phosphodiesterase class II)